MNNNRYIVFAVAATLLAGIFFSTLNFASRSATVTATVESTKRSERASQEGGAPASGASRASAGAPAAPSEQSGAARVPSEDSTLVVIPTIEGKTVYEAMLAYQAVGGITFTGRDFPGLGFMLETLGGRGPESGNYWFLYINDESAQKGASQITLKAGDRVEWRYRASE